MIKIIERREIDIVKWDELVLTTNNTTIFSTSVYLDSIAENWCLLVDEDYTSGIAIPYVIRLGVRQIYIPIFGRYLEWVGVDTFKKNVLILLKEYFRVADFYLRSTFEGKVEAVTNYQELVDLKLNSQAKRMITKFQKSEIEIQPINDSKTKHDLVLLIMDELKEKVDVFNGKSRQVMLQLTENLDQWKYINYLGFYFEGDLVGGMIFSQFNNRITYIKGSCKETYKKQGAMYACMNNVILDSINNGKVFDFGGSRIESIRRFNLSFGAIDVDYYRYSWNDAPFWWRIMKMIREIVK
jgi:hypothetical protein